MLDTVEKKTEKRSLRSYFWDTLDKSPEERKFLAKLDAFLLTYATLYLDQQNVTNAYVSGMQQDLGLHGNQLNYITTAWTCGYVIGQIPSNLIITRVRPSIWVPLMELIWSCLTMVLASAKNFETLVALRFFIGLAESSFFPAMSYVIGSWYKSDELAKRTNIFSVANTIGPMFSGFLQAGAYNGLRGVGGLAGWRWLFIIDGIITIPIALLGFLIMPDLPTNTRPSILYTQAQLDLANKRMEEIGRKPPAKFTKKKILGFFNTWHVWVMVPLYVLYNNGQGPGTTGSFIFWLSSFNKPGHTVYTVGQINTYPSGGYAIAAFLTLVYAWISDAINSRFIVIAVVGLWGMAVCIGLAATPMYTRIASRWALYYMTGAITGLAGIILAWVNELTGDDSEKRSFILGCCGAFAYVVQAWLPILIFPQVKQPEVFVGNVVTAVIDFAMVLVAVLAFYLQRRDEKAAALKRQESASIESSSDDRLDEKTADFCSVTYFVRYSTS